MCGDSVNTGVMEPPADQGRDVALPRVNQCAPSDKQWCHIGTQIKVAEQENGGQKTHHGTATDCNANTGMCRIAFDNGECNEFDDNNMKAFKMTPRTSNWNGTTQDGQ